MDCDLYVLLRTGKNITPEFCAQCPQFLTCQNKLSKPDINRMIIEERKLLETEVKGN